MSCRAPSRVQRHRTNVLLATAACAALAVPAPAPAADTWTNGSGNGAWDAADNWLDHSVPLLTDAVTFPAPGPTGRLVTLPVTGAMTAQSLTFNADYTLDGGRLDLFAAQPPAGASITVANNVTATINSQLGTSATANLTKSGPGTLVLNGPLLLNQNANLYIDAGALVVRSDASLGGQFGRNYTRGTLVVDGTFSTNKRFEPSNGTVHVTPGNTFTIASNDAFGFSMSDTWTKAGEGTLVVLGHSSRMGVTHVDAGTLRVEGDLGYGPLSVRGGTLELAPRFGGFYPSEVRIASGSTGRVQSARGMITVNNLTMPATADVFPTFAGATPADTLIVRTLPLSTPASVITVAGQGRVEVQQPSPYVGGWNVIGGTLRGNSTTLGPGASPVTVGGTGTLLVDGGLLNRAVNLNDGGTVRVAAPLSGPVHVAANASVHLATAAADRVFTIRPGGLSGGAGATIHLDGPGGFAVSGANTYAGDWTLNAGAALRVGDATSLGTGTGPVTFDNGSLRADAPVVSDRDLVILDAGMLYTDGVDSRFGALRAAAAADAARFTKAGPGTLRVKHVLLKSLDVAQGRLAIEPGAPVSRLGELAIQTEASLDLNDNDLIIDATSATRDAVLRDVHNLIATARNTIPRWREGLISSAAATNPLTTLAAVLNPGLASFGGEAIDENAIIVKYTYNGDANIDGRVNADDYFRIDSGFLEQPADSLYAQGDFNYDGSINADDYFLIDSAFLGQGQPLDGGTSTTLTAVPVPEPAAFLIPLAGLLFGLRRRRNR